MCSPACENRSSRRFIKHADYAERDPTGRSLHVSIVGGYAITYWEDFADRQVKVLEIAKADR